MVKYWNANGEYTQRPASELEVRDGIVVAEAHSVEPGKEPHFRLPMNGVFRADALKALVGLYGGQPFAWDGLLANLMLMDGKVVRMPEALYLRFQRAGSLTMAPQTSFGSAARQECDRISVAAYEVMWGIYDELRPNESPERRPEFAKRIAEYVQDLIPPARKLETADASARLKSELTQVLSLSTPVSGFISTM